MIPKVQPEKDFKDYFRKLKTADVSTYHVNHPPKATEEETKEPVGKRKIQEIDPYAVRQQDSGPFAKSKDLLASPARRKSSSGKRS